MTATTLPQDQRIGPYVIQGILGSGGMGVVYRAIAPNGRPVALKVLIHRDQAWVTRFERESRMRVEHPNIVRILDASTGDTDTSWIAFELLEGRSLDRVLQRGSMTADQVQSVGLQLCAGLDAAHARGIIHRDLKPANVFLTSTGEIKILDFGIAHWSYDARLTATAVVLGTPEYLAPEQARGEPIDERADIWGVGAVLYQALTGSPPYKRTSALATLVAVAMEPVRPLTDLAPQAPPGLAAVIHKALSKIKERRYASAAELGEALRSVNEPMTRDTIEVPLLGDEWRVVAVMLAEGVRDRARVEERVRRHGGRALPLVGDRALAMFGGAHWTGAEIEECALAALACRDDVDRVAIASGRAAQAQNRIIGDVITIVEQCSKENLEGVAVDREAARALAGVMPLVEVKPDVFELQPEGRRATSAVKSVIVGREVELASLEREAARAFETGSPQVVLVTGLPGIGKSRVSDELARRLERQDAIHVLRGRGRPHLRDRAYAVVRGMLETFADSRSAEGGARLGKEAPTRERQHALYRLVAEALEPEARAACAEFLAPLLGVELPLGVAAARPDPELMNDRILLALSDWFEGLAKQGALVLIAEDLQWADAASLQLIAELVERLAGRQFFVVGTARSDQSEALPFTPNMRIELAGLLSAHVGKLASSIAGAPLDDQTVRDLTERTGGNPLFVEQLVRAIDERGETDVAELPIPLTVEAAIQARLDQLPIQEKEAVKRASVFERPFQLRESEPLDLDATLLASLVRRGILTRTLAGRDARYAFKSGMVAEVAHRLISDRARAELHLRAAAVLEETKVDSPEEVARHYFLAGAHEPAARAYAEAALDHARRADSLGVVRCVKLAFELGAVEKSFELHMAHAEALKFLGHTEEHELALSAALDAAADRRDRARVLSDQLEASWRSGRAEEALSISLRAAELARASGDLETLVWVLGRRSRILVMLGRAEEAREALLEAANIAAGAPPRLRGFVAAIEALLAGQLGHHEARRDAFQRAAELYTEAGDLRRAAGARANLADVHNRLGSYAEAERALREAIEGCRRVRNRPMEGYALANLGYAIDMQGRPREALEVLESAERISHTVADSGLAALVRNYLAKVRLAIAPSIKVVELAEAAARDAESSGRLGNAVFAMTIASRAHLELGDVEEALSWSERALALRDQLGSVEEDEADVFLARAEALDRAGRAVDANVVRARGRRRVVELADAISDAELRARYLTDVPAHRRLWEDRLDETSRTR